MDISESNKPKVMQHYNVNQINNGGPATGALLLMQSELKDKYSFVHLKQYTGVEGFGIRLLSNLYKQIKKESPDILHIRGLQSDGFYGVLAGRLAGCKRIVISVHGIYSDTIGIRGLKRWVFKNIIETYALRNADLAYCVCEYAANRPFIRKNTKHLYGFIHNAAPVFASYSKSNVRKEIRTELNLSDNDIVIVTVGRVTIDKGFKTLLNTIIDLKFYSDIKFIIVGDGGFLSTMKDRKTELKLNNLYLLGKRSDVPKILLSSDIFVFPTLHENLSNALLEASEAGLPIIATKVGGNPEVVKDSISGFLVEPNDHKSMTRKILELYKDKSLREKMGSQAQANVRIDFSQKKIFSEIDNVYNFLLSK